LFLTTARHKNDSGIMLSRLPPTLKY